MHFCDIMFCLTLHRPWNAAAAQATMAAASQAAATVASNVAATGASNAAGAASEALVKPDPTASGGEKKPKKSKRSFKKSFLNRK